MSFSIDSQTPKEFFKGLVDDACEHQQVQASEESHFYLVSLLESFVRPENVFSSSGFAVDQPLAHVFLQAYSCEGVRRFALFKLTGDMALFLTGFFPESLYHQSVGSDYYVKLGGSAYTGAAATCGRRFSSEIYSELSTKFVQFADVLGEISESCTLTHDSNLLRLYETWLHTGSPRSASVLQREGVLLKSLPKQAH